MTFSTHRLLAARPGRAAALLLTLAFGVVRPALAQREVRHLNALTGAVGTTNKGVYYQFTYSRFVSDKVRFDVGGLLEHGPRDGATNGSEIAPYRGYELGLGFSPRLLRIGEAFYLRLPLQLRTRYERRPPVGGPPRSDGFSFGPSIALAADLYLLDRLSVYGELRQGWLPVGTVAEKYPRYFGAGLAYHLGM